MKKSDIQAIQHNRRLHEFQLDNACRDCEYFSQCCNKFADGKFSCPLDDVKSNIYKLNVAKHFADLSDVIEEPTRQHWKDICDVESARQAVYNFDKLQYLVTMPKCEPIGDWQKQFAIDATKTHVTCRFTMRDLRQRLREFLVYTPEGFTIGNEICNQLIRLLVPIDYQHLFNFDKGETK